ncbi:FAD-binding and (Fe-S)-binding domain-containing protein [Saccharopolyspora spinosa]|uniref:FAD/FMN-containing dehydrogenase n=1 Tax=Saccharopolyspora spinosa TaxID=60894 RepID=A0A2N3Y1A9_SACSN|nr:FAD-binding and (Fe-S)-binding domain-containing protein [Saccharopolyspora spinosa]PKW16682.1 FAD/FMN-containing dehydrogenase [Saccharopolyspora spinosa]
MANHSDGIGSALAALAREGVHEVDTSTRRRAEYSSDASLYRVLPSAVVFPRHQDEIDAVVEVCRSAGVPLTARGAGTSIAGNAIGEGIVVDFSRHLNRVLSIDAESAAAVVEPGVVLDDLQRAAAVHQLRFGPDPSTYNRCTIGGIIGNNACGSRALAYGRTSDNVHALEMVAGTGERLPLPNAQGIHSPTLSSVEHVVNARLEVIRTELGRFGRQASGYALDHLLPERGFDVVKAVVGTEGTWGLLRQATVRLVRPPEHTALVLLGYPDMATAADDAPALLRFDPVAVEGLDARIVDVVGRRRGTAEMPDLPRGEGWLFVEVAGGSRAELEATANSVIRTSAAIEGRVATSPAEMSAIWKIREDGAGHAARINEARPGLAGWEDAAVPPIRLGAYLRRFEKLLGEFGLSGVPYGHFGDGCVHVRIDFPLGESNGKRVFRDFLVEAAKLVAEHGGSMSGEHGDGRARGELLPYMYSNAALEAFAAVKEVFDPAGILNPGVIVRTRPVDADMRLPAATPIRANLGFAYTQDAGKLDSAVQRCTGIGKCRVTSGGGVMCPSYRATRDEKDSTRGRIRVLQELANGSLEKGWRGPELMEALDLCLSCKACSSECPTGVDMAVYKAEALHQRYKGRLRPASHYALGWLPWWSRIASRAPKVVNRLMASRFSSLAKRMGGVDSRRPLPAFAEKTFRSLFAEHPHQSGTPVMLWVDTFTEHFTPAVAVAAARVLESAGYSVSISPRGTCCGLTWVSTGQLGVARRLLAKSIRSLAPVAQSGVPIVGLEPSCAAVFRGDAQELLGDGEDVAAVSGNVVTLAELLAGTEGWRPPRLDGVNAVMQPHCHQRAVMGIDRDRQLLSEAGAKISTVDGCCGLAGNFGAERGHYDLSIAVARNSLLPAVEDAPEGAVVLTDGFSCRVQLDHLAQAGGKHLAELLADHLTADGIDSNEGEGRARRQR